jgi:diadenosine tetraphosphate (Ap4A) HIT family hydrolase
MKTQDSSSKQCCICEEIKSHELPNDYVSRYRISNRFCYEDDNFVIFPSISPLVSGHILLFPKIHVSNLAALSDSMLSQINVLGKMVQFHENIDRKYFFFEHGVKNDIGGCGITHAHLHILPLPSEISNQVIIEIQKDFPSITHGNLGQIKDEARRSTAYLFYGIDLLDLTLSLAEEIPSQYIRKIIAEKINKSDWDWRNLTEEKKFLETYATYCDFYQ